MKTVWIGVQVFLVAFVVVMFCFWLSVVLGAVPAVATGCMGITR